jgi:hypothetical protein
MTILSPSGLETDTYEQQGWHSIYNANVDRLNRLLLKVNSLLDVDTKHLKDGAILTWNATDSKWEMRTYG